MFREDERSLFDNIRFHFHKKCGVDASGKSEVIGAHNNDQWLQERIYSEAENNLGENTKLT